MDPHAMPNLDQLTQAVVVVTGASSGIGRATALAFAARGASVVLAARRESPLRALARQCERAGGHGRVVVTDVTDPEAVAALAQAASAWRGAIDIWVNNAGVTLFGPFVEAPLNAQRRVIETNLLGTIYAAQSVLPRFLDRQRGVLINMASMDGWIAPIFSAAYAASKFGVVGLGQSLRQEYRNLPNIHICTVCPAFVDTPLFQHAANYMGRAVKPVPPLYAPERVAEAIVALALEPRAELAITPASRALKLQHRAFPRTTERLVSWWVARELVRRRAAAPTSGALFAPMIDGRTSSGGWRASKRLRAGLTLGLAGVAALALTGLRLPTA